MSYAEAMVGSKRGHDLEGERQAVGGGMIGQQMGKQYGQGGFQDNMADVLMGDVMDRVKKDKLGDFNKQVESQRLAAEEANMQVSLKQQIEEDRFEDEEDGKAAAVDDDLEMIRQRRMEKMRQQFEKNKEYKQKGHGEYEEITEEDFLKTVTASHRTIVHFYHNRFESSKVMDMHLKKCAKKFMGTKFCKLDAEKAPFFIGKLAIQTLPTVAMFIDGVLVWKQLGFAGLEGGETREVKTGHLARVFRDCGCIEEDFDSDDDMPN